MKRIFAVILIVLLSTAALATAPYVYGFPKPEKNWGRAVAFNNLSPGFFQIMYLSNEGILRIATYGIVGSSMDNLKDPQLMMVFKFDQERTLGEVEYDSRLAGK
jgi:hypothetical protein